MPDTSITGYVFLGIICGIFLMLWLKERPIFRCVFCSKRVKHKQPHCHSCGKVLQWDWIQRKPYLMTRYQSDEQFRKWDILIPNIKQKDE